MSLELEHWSSPNGCHEDCPACAAESDRDEPQFVYELDPAAVLGAAMSLYKAGHVEAERQHCNLSEAYSGGDEFMRQCMRVATVFETWACSHVNFDGTSDCWPYLLEDQFGAAFYSWFHPSELTKFTATDCPLVAVQLKLLLLASA